MPEQHDTPLWQPSPERIANANITAFMAELNRRWDAGVNDYAGLHRFSVAEAQKFWRTLWSFAGVIAESEGTAALRDGHLMPGARWFPEARLNYAQNLLRRRDEAPAIIFRSESGMRQELTFAELYNLVSRLAQALRASGVRRGDRVAAVLPNMPVSVALLLACASVGAVFSSCSPDFGVAGVRDRFGQIAPGLLFVVDGYFYGGKIIDCTARAAEIAQALPSVERVVVVPYAGPRDAPAHIPGACAMAEFIRPFDAADIEFARMAFNDPLYMLYSSGTTGVPKCIVHGAGGTLLQHLKEHLLHCDIKPGDRPFYFTTMGWMMWNWLVSGLAAGATLLLYDGSPFHPDGNVLFDFAAETHMTHFGTSAKYLDAVRKAGLHPIDTHDLSALRTILSTGSPLAAESFDFVYADIKSDVCLSSISGGTDIVACFVGGNPIGPVWRGEIQAPCLAMDVQVFDDDGKSVRGEKGELVCRNPFPSMPLGFWDDDDGARYHAAYFERFKDVWCHGDFAEITEHDGIVIHGRSDAVLNPGGVRIGTAEIYRQAEQLDEIEEAIAVAQEWDGDVRIVLFVRLAEGAALDEALVAEIKRRIRAATSPRHVPAKVLGVADIPRTMNGKITELAVREVIHGRAVKNMEALANPEALDYFRDREELRA